MEERIISALKKIVDLDANACQLQADREKESNELENYYKEELELFYKAIEKDKQEGRKLYDEALIQATEQRKLINAKKEENIKKLCSCFEELKAEMAHDIIRKLLI